MGGISPHQGIRVGSEGHHTGAAAMAAGQIVAGLQQCLMAQMHAVKKAQSIDGVFHISLPSVILADGLYTSKKLLIVDITPPSTFASMRNSPPWL